MNTKKFLTVVMTLCVMLAGCGRGYMDLGSWMLKYIGPSVVMLKGRGGGATGFVTQLPNGQIVTMTNGHVCDLAYNGALDAFTQDGRKQTVYVIKQSETADLCVTSGVLNVEPIRIAKRMDDREHLNLIGHPHLDPLTYAEGYPVVEQVQKILYREGNRNDCPQQKFVIESYFGRTVCIMVVKAVYTSVIGYPGNSGSPVLNDDGYLVGVVFAGNNNTNKMLMVPLAEVHKFIAELLQ